jgi:hypothetical protein
MGAWDATSFGNDTANDWAYDLEECEDLSLIESTLERVQHLGTEYIESGDATEAIAAAEVLAWLKGKPSQVDAYTEKIAEWVAAHPIVPPTNLLMLARAVLARLRTESSELAELWEEDPEWIAAMDDLDERLS